VTFFGGSGIVAPDRGLVSAGDGRPSLAAAALGGAAVEASGGRGPSLRTRRIETDGAVLDAADGD
jgi:hypothetical protein